ncbi:hypothetical protein ACHAXT_003041 [Thalassiosira profunda]
MASVVSSLYAPGASPASRGGANKGAPGGGPSRPLSSVSLAPGGDGTAVAAGKDMIHVLRLRTGSAGSGGGGVRRLEEVRSARISQHFQSAIQTTNAAAAGGQTPQYPHLREVFPGSVHSSAPLPTPSAGGGGGITINVTDVAWSLSQPYVVDLGIGSASSKSSPASQRGKKDGSGLGDSYEELIASEIDASEHSQDRHYPTFIRRTYVGGGEQRLEDTSVVAAAGSNGVVVAWSARALLGDFTAPSPGNVDGGPGGLFHPRKNRPQVPPPASIGQPEAAFVAHSRAVNRLAWHPTGSRPYLLLTASQDGSVKLWDRRASSSSPPVSGVGVVSNVSFGQQSTLNLSSSKSWFGFGGAPSVQNAQASPSNAMARTATWHCVSTYQPKCEAVRDVRWNPFIDDVFAMVAGEWLCVYDIRINKPMVKESTHAGDATSVDWHPTRPYTIATGGGRDRSVKVWDIESSLNIFRHDDAPTNIVRTNSGSYKSENSETMSTTSHTSSDAPLTSTSNEPSQTLSVGSSSPVKRTASGIALSHSRHHKKKLPLHVLNIAAPVTRIRWRPPEDATSDSGRNHHDTMIAVATSSIYGANAGGNGAISLWSYLRPFMPLSICEGHFDGAVSDFAWADCTLQPSSGSAVHQQIEQSSLEPMSVKSTIDSYAREGGKISLGGIPEREWQTVLTVGRDGQILLQDFSRGERPILDVPNSTFALANLSPFQPGYGSLQIMAIHQRVSAPELKRSDNPARLDRPRSDERVISFSITDAGDVGDLSKTSLPSTVDIAPELTHLSRFSELYAIETGDQFATKADVCRYNATVAEGLNRRAIAQMWKTLATLLEGSGMDSIPSDQSALGKNPLAFVLVPTLRNLLLQRADAGDVQTVVVLCEVMDVIIPPNLSGGTAATILAPDISIRLVQEWYLSYIDLLQQMCLFSQAASLIRKCKDPVVGALNQQSTTIHESCPRCGKPQDNVASGPQLSAQRVCRSCRSRIGLCFLCHEPVKGIFVWCPGCGHGGHLDHALEWFGMNEVCPTGCGHKCNLFPLTKKA